MHAQIRADWIGEVGVHQNRGAWRLSSRQASHHPNNVVPTDSYKYDLPYYRLAPHLKLVVIDHPPQHQAPSREILQFIIPNDPPPFLLFIFVYKTRSIRPFVRPQRLPMSFLSLLRHTKHELLSCSGVDAESKVWGRFEVLATNVQAALLCWAWAWAWGSKLNTLVDKCTCMWICVIHGSIFRALTGLYST